MRKPQTAYLRGVLLLLLPAVGIAVAYLHYGASLFAPLTEGARLILSALTVLTLIAVAVRVIANALRRRGPRLPKSIQTINQTVDARLLNLFTNQERALSAFEHMLERGEPRLKVLSIAGVSGSGKSWVLRYCRHVAQERDLLVSLVDGAAISTLERSSGQSTGNSARRGSSCQPTSTRWSSTNG